MSEPSKPSHAKLIISIIQWAISVLAIPALVWAWNLSTQVQLQQQEIAILRESAYKSDEHAIELAKMNATLNHLKEKLNDIKDILRE